MPITDAALHNFYTGDVHRALAWEDDPPISTASQFTPFIGSRSGLFSPSSTQMERRIL
jgi:hypothetical protein